MGAWLSENYVTIIVSLVLLAVVALVIRKLVRDKKRGRSTCGCGCANCPMSGSCHNKQP